MKPREVWLPAKPTPVEQAEAGVIVSPLASQPKMPLPRTLISNREQWVFADESV